MKTNAIRLYGANDLRLENFELPPIKADELLVKIVTDSACMSTYKAVTQGAKHKRVPNNVAENPVIVGHEFCGEIIEVGAKLAGKFKAGQKFTMQPGMKGTMDAAGYSFPHLGGNMTYGIIPACYFAQNGVLLYEGAGYFNASLAEPLSCVIGATKANYHTRQGEYVHDMDIKNGGNMAILGGCGPMGFAHIDYILHRERTPKVLIVTDIKQDNLDAAAAALSPKMAEKLGIKLVYFNPSASQNAVEEMMALTGGHGYDDVFVFYPVAALVEQADAMLAYDGCLNFFAGPQDTGFTAPFNFYNVHYNATHVVGTNAGNIDDMKDALAMAAAGKINPALLVSHIGGLDAASETILNLPNIAGFKKLIYNEISLPLTAIKDFEKMSAQNPLFGTLAEICARHNDLWNVEAETYLLNNAPRL
ncbi:MAG: zinc-binding dehydrogenase [Defluviitaleaceae bacterium]|nr:zinc-binding dehydrogenase [Defluviitaleaceae bacterium]MCL2275603.1 zinc-binding dehydrogenase [Defluviitaleaceae bacterium]